MEPIELYCNAKNLAGLEFGYLKAIQPVAKRTSGGNVTWECLCRCGKTVTREARELRRPPRGKYGMKIKSCGCTWSGSSSPRFKGFGNISSQKWTGLKRGAARRKVEFTITIEEAWALLVKQEHRCAITGVEIVQSPRHAKYRSTASLDRIDSSRGYVPGNVQWVHVTINFMKQTLSMDDFIRWCRAVTIHAGGKGFPIEEDRLYY